MAFSLRHIISNIPYFKKSGDESSPSSENLTTTKKRRHISLDDTGDSSKSSCSDIIEDVDRKCNETKLLETTDQVATLSDTEVFTIDITSTKHGKNTSKKLKLDIATISGSTEIINQESVYNSCGIENTPQQISLQNRRSEIFSERLKEFDLSRSFDIFDLMNDKETEPNYDIESLSEHSESDASLASHDSVKMCRKVQLLSDSQSSDGEHQLVHSSSIESFVDIGLDKNEDDRISLLLAFQVKFEKLERLLQKLLNEFQFHIEVSKVFQTKSIVTALPGSDLTKLPKKYLGEITYLDEVSRGPSPAGTWNIVIENEDNTSKFKLRKQLLSMKHYIENFVREYLHNAEMMKANKAIASNLKMTQIIESTKKGRQKRLRINKKKRERCMNDFPDLEEVLQKLFSLDTDIHSDISNLEVDTSGETDEKCTCKCRYHKDCSASSHTDSGVKTCEDKLNQSITSSIGNFSLNSNSLSAYSESLDNIISYCSFNDSSIYNSILQKPAIERITFYVKVHSIELKSDDNDMSYDLKPRVVFYCHSCFTNQYNEQDLIKHILTQKHCEKIHFLYKNAYIKKCLASNQEIMPSTVLNPMKMYRDDNKIVCFGDGIFACSLCLENNIIGESVLMAHCDTEEHQERRDRLNDLLEHIE